MVLKIMKFLADKRTGISTVIASAILLGGVAVIGSGIVLWANSKLSSSEIALSSLSSTNTNKFNEFLAIENVWFCKTTCSSGATPPRVNVTMTNIGTVGLNVTQIQLTNSTTITVTKTLKPTVPILPTQSYMWSNGYTSKNPVTVTITTARGTIFTTQVTPP